MKKFLLAVLLFLAACTPAAAPVGTAQLVKINATSATRPWLAEAYTCADGLNLVLADVNDPAQADVSLRLGEPERLASPAFQIDRDDLLVVTNRESPLQNMSEDQVQNLFARPEDPSIQVWVFSQDEDVQLIFAREVMRGQIVTSLARLAFSPQQMSDTINKDKNSVGILPRHWKAGTVRDIFTLPNIPVLAVTKSEPQGLIKSFLACLQK